jgi:hypothetical protein
MEQNLTPVDLTVTGDDQTVVRCRAQLTIPTVGANSPTSLL